MNHNQYFTNGFALQSPNYYGYPYGMPSVQPQGFSRMQQFYPPSKTCKIEVHTSGAQQLRYFLNSQMSKEQNQNQYQNYISTDQHQNIIVEKEFKTNQILKMSSVLIRIYYANLVEIQWISTILCQSQQDQLLIEMLVMTFNLIQKYQKNLGLANVQNKTMEDCKNYNLSSRQQSGKQNFEDLRNE